MSGAKALQNPEHGLGLGFLQQSHKLWATQLRSAALSLVPVALPAPGALANYVHVHVLPVHTWDPLAAVLQQKL